MPKREERTPMTAIQIGFGRELGESILPSVSLEILGRLRPTVGPQHTPLVIVASLLGEPTGTMAIETVVQPAVGQVEIFPTLVDLALNIGIDKTKELLGSQQPHGVVIFIDWRFGDSPLMGSDSPDLLRKLACRSLGSWRYSWKRRIWLVETSRQKPLSEEEINLRKKFLTSLGLVKANVCQDQKKSLVWTTARPEKRARRRGVNMLAKKYISPIKAEVEATFSARGYRVVSWQEIDSLLADSKMPPWDLATLKSGFGINILAPCGRCVYRIDKKGSISPLLTCDEEHEDVIWEEIVGIPLFFGRDGPTGVFCRECGKQFLLTRILGNQKLLKEKERIAGDVIVLEEIKCSAHGVVSINKRLRLQGTRAIIDPKTGQIITIKEFVQRFSQGKSH